LLLENNFSTKMDELSKVRNGLLRNITRRSLIAQDDPWWSSNNSDWKLTIYHEYAPEGTMTPDFWMDEVLDLCEHEALHKYFGLTFNDLMHMDPASFEKIRRRVYDFEKRWKENDQYGSTT
jgi:hypothetical protein